MPGGGRSRGAVFLGENLLLPFGSVNTTPLRSAIEGGTVTDLLEDEAFTELLDVTADDSLNAGTFLGIDFTCPLDVVTVR